MKRVINIIRDLVELQKAKIKHPKEEDPGVKIVHVGGVPHSMIKTKTGYSLVKQDDTRKAHSKYLPPGTDLSKMFNIDIVDK